MLARQARRSPGVRPSLAARLCEKNPVPPAAGRPCVATSRSLPALPAGLPMDQAPPPAWPLAAPSSADRPPARTQPDHDARTPFASSIAHGAQRPVHGQLRPPFRHPPSVQERQAYPPLIRNVGAFSSRPPMRTGNNFVSQFWGSLQFEQGTARIGARNFRARAGKARSDNRRGTFDLVSVANRARGMRTLSATLAPTSAM